MRLRGEAPQTYFSNTKLNNSKYLILQFYSKIRTFLQKWLQGKSLEKRVTLCISVILLVKNVFFSVHNPISFISLSFNKLGKITNLTKFRLKIMVFFKWPEIRKYWSYRTEPKCGNGNEHFNFVFSLVKCSNSSFFACHSRELTCRTWLGTL